MNSILFINRVFPPVQGATGQLLAELAPALVKAGWRVTVLTAASTSIASRHEEMDGVRVERVAGLPFTRKSHWRRALSYLSLYPALLYRAWRLPRHDVVVTLTDPPLLVVLGWIISFLKRTSAVHWAQDLYPELAEELGVLKRAGWIANLLRWFSTRALRQCGAVVALGRCMRDRLRQRGLDQRKVEVIGNWGHGLCHGARRDENPFRKTHNLAGRFVVMYSGNFGMAHPFETIVEAIAKLESSHREIVFLFIGDGPRLAWVKQQVAARGLSLVRFLPFQPKDRLIESLGAADLHVATMEPNLCGLVVPSKVAGILSVGRPCLFIGPAESEAARLILEHEFGEVLTVPDADELARRLVRWMEQPQRLFELQKRAPAVAATVGQAAAVAAFDRLFRRVLGLPERTIFESSSNSNTNASETSTCAPASRPDLQEVV